jgi:hypothetical protein
MEEEMEGVFESKMAEIVAIRHLPKLWKPRSKVGVPMPVLVDLEVLLDLAAWLDTVPLQVLVDTAAQEMVACPL